MAYPSLDHPAQQYASIFGPASDNLAYKWNMWLRSYNQYMEWITPGGTILIPTCLQIISHCLHSFPYIGCPFPRLAKALSSQPYQGDLVKKNECLNTLPQCVLNCAVPHMRP